MSGKVILVTGHWHTRSAGCSRDLLLTGAVLWHECVDAFSVSALFAGGTIGVVSSITTLLATTLRPDGRRSGDKWMSNPTIGFRRSIEEYRIEAPGCGDQWRLRDSTARLAPAGNRRFYVFSWRASTSRRYGTATCAKSHATILNGARWPIAANPVGVNPSGVPGRSSGREWK